jgi:hypothetical protein
LRWQYPRLGDTANLSNLASKASKQTKRALKQAKRAKKKARQANRTAKGASQDATEAKELAFKRPPGRHTYELRYADPCPCVGSVFSNRILRVAPRL